MVAPPQADLDHEQAHERDPWSAFPGMPPNAGQFGVPHVFTFQGILSSIAKVYRPSDEALKDSLDNARYMRNDPIVMECVEQRQRGAALLEWDLEPDNEADPQQQQLVRDLKRIIERIPRFMQYRENLLHATWFGRYAVQQRFRWGRIDGQPRIIIDRWRPVHGDKLVFKFTETQDEEKIGIRVGTGCNAGQRVADKWVVEKISQRTEATDYGLAYFLNPWERPLLAVHKHYIEDGEYEDPLGAGRIHGVGVRSRIYWAWYQKQECLAFLMEFLERSATGIEIWYYPWGNAEARETMKQAAAERIGQGRNILLVPRMMEAGAGTGYAYDRIEPSMAGAEALKAIITEYFGHQIKRFILGQTLTSEAHATGLGSGVADVHLSTYMLIIRYDASLLEETLTTDLVNPLKRFNFPWADEIPVRFRIKTEADDVESKLAAWKQAYDMGARLKAEEVYNLIGATKPDEGDEVLEASAMQPDPFGLGSAAGGAGEAGGRPAVVPGFDPAQDGDVAGGNEPEAEHFQPAGVPSANSERKPLGATQEVVGYGARQEIADAAAATDVGASDARKQAGNYRKGKVTLHGLTISIENPKGSLRRPEWKPLAAHYGYINRTEGRDGDHVDVFLGPHPESEIVFVIDQVTEGGRFDEHKAMLGWTSAAKARDAYLANYPAGWRCGEVTALTIDQFKAWLAHGDTTKPLAAQVSKYSKEFREEDVNRDVEGKFAKKDAHGEGEGNGGDDGGNDGGGDSDDDDSDLSKEKHPEEKRPEQPQAPEKVPEVDPSEAEAEPISERDGILLERFGLTPDEVANLVGALDDAEVYYSCEELGPAAGDPWIDWVVDVSVEHADYRSHRQIRKHVDGRLTIYNVGFTVLDESQGQGIGRRVFYKQAKFAAEAGYAYLECDAARGGPYVGWSVWPKLGYDVPIPGNLRDRLPPGLADAQTVLDLYETAEGAKWWEENGVSITMRFDLSPNSRSWQTLNRYLARSVRTGTVPEKFRKEGSTWPRPSLTWKRFGLSSTASKSRCG